MILILQIILFLFSNNIILLLSECNDFDDNNINHESNLPIFPSYFPYNFNLSKVESLNNPYEYSLEPFYKNETYNIISKNVWISFKMKPNSTDDIDEELKNVIYNARMEGWHVYLLGHEEQINFFEYYFPNTSLLWAVKEISPSAAVSVSDIWRVAVTYVFGGFYMDDDADIRHSLNDIISSNDSMIVPHELTFRRYNHQCYQNDFKLSYKALKNKYGAEIQEVRQVTQYMFFAKQRHTLLKKILENIVEGIKLEYFGRHPFFLHVKDQKWKYVVCATGPEIWGVSYLESVLLNDTSADKVVLVNFIKDYTVTFKVHEAKHYRKRVENRQHYYHMDGETYLNSYHPSFCTDHLEGKPIRLHSKMYLFVNKQLRAFPNYDTFCAFNFTLHDLVIFQKFPKSLENVSVGLDLPSLDWQHSMC